MYSKLFSYFDSKTLDDQVFSLEKHGDPLKNIFLIFLEAFDQ